MRRDRVGRAGYRHLRVRPNQSCCRAGALDEVLLTVDAVAAGQQFAGNPAFVAAVLHAQIDDTGVALLLLLVEHNNDLWFF